MTKFEWLSHQHRDTTTSIVGHSPLLMFTAIADNQSTQRIKFELTQVSFFDSSLIGVSVA